MTGRKRITTLCCIFLIGLLGLFGCGSPSSNSMESNSTEEKYTSEVADTAENKLVYEHSMDLQYAENFSADYYEGGYKILTTMDGTKILIVPKGKDTPAGDFGEKYCWT